MTAKVFYGFVLLLLPQFIKMAPGGPETCQANWKKVGCFYDPVVSRPLADQTANNRDNESEVFIGKLTTWDANYPLHLRSLACTCAQEARKQGFSHFGLQFYGECWSGNWNRANAELSENCFMSDQSGFPVTRCDHGSSEDCTGGAHANYVYEVNGFTQAASPAGTMEGAKVPSQVGSGRINGNKGKKLTGKGKKRKKKGKKRKKTQKSPNEIFSEPRKNPEMRPNAEGAKKGEAPVSSTKPSTKQIRKGSRRRNKNRSGNKRRKGSQKSRKNAGGVSKTWKASPPLKALSVGDGLKTKIRVVPNAEARVANKENTDVSRGDRGQLRGQVATKKLNKMRKNRRKKNRKGRKKDPKRKGTSRRNR